MEVCYIKGCNNLADFTCSCNANLFICSQHVLTHQDMGFHSLQLLYAKLEKSVERKAIKVLSTTISNLNEAINLAKNRAEELILQINVSLGSTLTALYGQKEYYENLLINCQNPKGVNKIFYKEIWRSLSALGSKDLWKIKDFSGGVQVNPILLALKGALDQLAQPLNVEMMGKLLQNANSDFSFREILEFFSEIPDKDLELVHKNADFLIKELKKPELVNLISTPSKVFKPSCHKFTGLGILFSHHPKLTPNLTINPIINNFLETELTKTVIKTAKNLKSLKPLLPDLINLPTSNIVDFISSINFTFTLTNQELIQTLLENFEFKQYCNLIKQFLLMGQGDFFHLLFEELFIYQRVKNLDTLFEECYWKTNARKIPEKIFKSLTLKQDEDFIIIEWDSYKLDMEIKYPLSLLLSKDIVKELHRVFSFIWQLKRVDFLLKQNSYQRKILGCCLPADLKALLHRLNIFRFKLTGFINLSMFFFFEEVIETGWKKFNNSVSVAEDLEDLDLAIKELVQYVQLYNFLNAKLLYQKFFSILRLIIKFIDLQYEIENSIVLDEESSDNDYSDSAELLKELESDFSAEFDQFKSELIYSQNQLFAYFHLNLNDL